MVNVSGGHKSRQVMYFPPHPTLREQNLIGNVLAHIEVERKRQAGWAYFPSPNPHVKGLLWAPKE